MADIAGKDALRALGYRVEDMGAEYGPSFAGQHRWVNLQGGMFQDVPSTTEDDAWAQAFTHHLVANAGRRDRQQAALEVRT